MSAPRRALHVFSTFGAGGPQVRATQICARMGPCWQHDIVAMNGDVAAAAMLPPPVARRLLPAPPRRSFLANVRAFVRLLRELRPDLLLTYNWGAIEAVAAARWLGFAAHVHHEDGFLREEFDHRLWRRNWLRRRLLRHVHVIVPSTPLWTIARAEWRLGGLLARCPNGVDCERYAPPAPGPAERRPFTVGTVGGLRDEKAYGVLLEAIAAMTARARVLLVGDGPDRPRLEQLARELELGDRAVFAGATVDTAPVYRQMDVFALSSRTEQMPLSMLEAMASGLPVASTDVGDVRVMLPAECRGALVPAGDARALAQALDALAADPARRAREGLANRRHCERHYELGACVQRYVDIYEAVAAPRGAAARGVRSPVRS